jgi:hypothetical protein
MDKRYQVFLSSTYADLRDERRRVFQTLMEMDCIPAGMELFPAADEEQWAFIRRVINDCDYYLLIVGNRYGSLTPEGMSYTEREFDYALERSLPVLAFLHESPDDLAVSRSDIDPSLRERLKTFRAKVAAGRLVRFWRSSEELPGLVALSLSKTIKTYPATGWVRTTQASNAEVLTEVNELRKVNGALEKEVQDLRTQVARKDPIPDLAPLTARFDLSGTIQTHSFGSQTWAVKTTWAEIFALVAPHLLGHPHDASVNSQLARDFGARSGKPGYNATISDEIFQTIKIQLMAQGLVQVEYLKTVKGGMGLFWSLTKKGAETMMSVRTVRKA